MSNNNLDSVEVEAASHETDAKDTEPTPEQQPPQDPMEMMDPTGKARQAALGKVSEVLVAAAKGSKINQRKLISALRNLYFVCDIQSKMIGGMTRDFQMLMQMLGNAQGAAWANRAKQRAIMMLLEDKEITTIEELETIHNERAVPAIMEEMKAQHGPPPSTEKEETVETTALAEDETGTETKQEDKSSVSEHASPSDTGLETTQSE